MATYSPQDLFRLWKQQQLSVEMTTGHILQNMVTMQDAIDALKRDIAEMRTNKPTSPTLGNEGNSTTINKRKPHKS